MQVRAFERNLPALWQIMILFMIRLLMVDEKDLCEGLYYRCTLMFAVTVKPV